MRCNICGWVNPNGVSQCQKCGHSMLESKEENQAEHRSQNDFAKQPDSFYQADEDRQGAMILLIIAGLYALLGGFWGMMLGFYIYYAKIVLMDPVNRKILKLTKYKESHRTAGLIIAILGLIIFLIWCFLSCLLWSALIGVLNSYI